MTLPELGWTGALAEAFAPHAAEGLVPARVAVAYGATFRVLTEAGDELADVSGRLRHEARGRRDLPAVGDWVAVKPTAMAGGRATIQAILPRTSLFSRKAAGDETVEQVLATNVDTAFLVTGLDHDFNVRRLERYLAMTWESGAAPVVLLNKADISPALDEQVAEARQVALGVPVHAISARENRGLDALAPYLQPGRTVVVLGSSGVGKSTIINRLLGEERLKTREVRATDQRGRHTTTHRELVVLPGGALLIDTPGMRELQLWSADAGMDEAFEDIATIARGCHFGDCRHETEPRCAVKAAVEAGTLPAERLDNYRKLQGELHALAARQETLAQQAKKKSDRVQAKALRKHLETKGNS
jgi:ribosome biogenesis GTPase